MPHDKTQSQQSTNNPDDLLNLLDPNTKTVDQAFLKAKEALNKGDNDRALFYFVRVMKLDNKNIRALLGIAAIHKKQNNDAFAEKIYLDILAIDGNNSIANEYIGLKKLKNREIDEAKIHLNKAITSSTLQWQSHNGLGVIADLDKDFLTAIHHYSEARRLDAVK